MIKRVLFLIVFCAVIAMIKSDGYNGRPGSYMQPMQGYTRIKRVKYSNPPQRFYSRPPSSYANKGAFSYTPPPNYMMDSEEPPSPYPGNPYPGNSRPKVSKRPKNEGLGEEDLQNFVKYLSKQDLDKILEFAGQNRDSERYNKDLYEKHIDYRPTTDEYKSIYNSKQDPEKFSQKSIEDESKKFTALVQEIDSDPQFNPNQEKKPSYEYKNHVASYADPTPGHHNHNDYQGKRPNNSNFDIYVTDPRTQYQEKNPVIDNFSKQANYATDPTPLTFYTEPPTHFNNAPLDTQESIHSQIIFSNTPNKGVLTTDSKIMPEENLPMPVNLRDDQDFEVSFTKNVATVVKADASYKLENFGDLPLMNYNSKLDTLSSYHVPHYTVTSSESLSSQAAPPPPYAVAPSSYSSSSRVPAVEPAPPSSSAREQSDAHLKAVRIWSHKSKGTAYTLHDDGTLSLEKPGRPKGGYGYP